MNEIQLFVVGSRKVMPGDDDRRYRITVNLLNSVRPKYWSFHCNYCGEKICELSGSIVSIQDTDDVNKYIDRPPPILIRCKGRNKGEYCHMWYEIANLL
jgi:hypothetical protein